MQENHNLACAIDPALIAAQDAIASPACEFEVTQVR